MALIGGEVLLRPQFVHRVVYYGVKKGFWVCLPTTGRLMRKEVVDWIGDAGAARVNLAVDSVEDRKGLPKARAYGFREQIEEVGAIAARLGAWLVTLLAALLALWILRNYRQRRLLFRTLRVAESGRSSSRSTWSSSLLDLRTSVEVVGMA